MILIEVSFVIKTDFVFSLFLYKKRVKCYTLKRIMVGDFYEFSRYI